MKYYVLSLKTPERLEIFEQNKKIMPELEIKKSINGYDIDETLDIFLKLDLKFEKMFSNTYGTLANFLTKYLCLLHQIENNIDYMCFLEDDLLFSEKFKDFTNQYKDILTDDTLNMIRLGDWGEGYITSLESAKRIKDILLRDGIIQNVDNQFRLNMGKRNNFK